MVYEEDGGTRAKVIDFGFSCFGSFDDDEVLLPSTLGWAAPEIRDMPLTIEAAKRTDIYSYGKVCAWILADREDLFSQPSVSVESIDSLLDRARQRWTSFWQGDIDLEREFFITWRCFLERSWHKEADKRATVSDVVDYLLPLVRFCELK